MSALPINDPNCHGADDYFKDDEEEKIPEVPDEGTPQGVLPRLIATLVARRRQVKSLMKDRALPHAKLLQVSSQC